MITARTINEPLEHAPLYTLSQACKVARLPVGTGRSWFKKSWLRYGPGDQPAHVAGATARISERSLVVLTIAAELVRVWRVHPRVACQVGLEVVQRASDDCADGNVAGAWITGGPTLLVVPDGRWAILPPGATAFGLMIRLAVIGARVRRGGLAIMRLDATDEVRPAP